MDTEPQNPNAAAVFQRYSAYYDLLYQDKDYAREAGFVHRLLADHGRRCGRILELGCGTGRHALELAALGWNVRGYDFSTGMVDLARQRAAGTGARVSFEVGDVRCVREPAQFAAVISLFHVMSYQTTDADLRATIATAAAHLEAGGLFLFDFWFGPAVLSDPPTKRLKRLANDRLSVVRRATPTVDLVAHTVKVHYDIQAEDLAAKESFQFTEDHLLRYLFLSELTTLLADGGFAVADTGNWMQRTPATPDGWYAWLLARRT